MLKTSIIAGIIVGLFVAFLLLMPSRETYLTYSVGIGLTLFFIGHYMLSTGNRKKRIGAMGFWIPVVSLSCLFFLMPVAFAAALYLWKTLSIFTCISTS
jgi:hypothetical protein